METTVKDRLILFIKQKGITVRQFERSIGVSNGYVSKITGTIGADKLHKMSVEYPELNVEWLMVGDGDMISEGNTISGDENISANNINGNNEQNGGKVIEVLSAQLSEKDRQIDRLLGIIERLS